jgi:hypothetical protein
MASAGVAWAAALSVSGQPRPVAVDGRAAGRRERNGREWGRRGLGRGDRGREQQGGAGAGDKADHLELLERIWSQDLLPICGV